MIKNPQISLLLLALFLIFPSIAQATEKIPSYSLQDCIASALVNNRRNAVAKEGQAIARAQHQQALSAYWPSLSFSATGTIDDEDPMFVTGKSSITLPGMGTLSVPEQKSRLRDRKNLDMDVTASYLLWAGGKRSAIARQAEVGVDIAGLGILREELMLTLEAKMTYYGLVLARQLKTLGHDTLERMSLTLFVTKEFYEQGLGGVLKTDYLKNKYFVETIKSTVAGLDSNTELAETSLVNIMGLDWQSSIDIADETIPFDPVEMDVKSLVDGAYEFNVDMRSIKLALEASEEKINEVQADYFPIISLFGNFRKTVNSYDMGMVSDTDKKRLTGGFNVILPLFNGFRTKEAVREARAALRRLKNRKIVLEQGLALHTKHLYLAASRTSRQVETTRNAMIAAQENRVLNEKAYTMQMVKTRDVIEAQVAESLTAAGHYRALYAHYEAIAKIEMLLGEQIADVLAAK